MTTYEQLLAAALELTVKERAEIAHRLLVRIDERAEPEEDGPQDREAARTEEPGRAVDVDPELGRSN